jgi:RNA-directed DNA polymerase
VQVPGSEGLANHAGPESCGFIGNGRHEALTGEDAGRVLSPEIGLVLGANALRTRGRPHRGYRFGEVSTDPAGSETSGMHGNTVSGTREVLHLAWQICQVRTVNLWGTTVMDGCRESDSFIVPRKPSNKGRPPGTGGEGGGKGAGQGERGGVNQEPDTAPGSPVTCAQPRTAGTFGCLHVDPRQEPGAVVPHAGICAGGIG